MDKEEQKQIDKVCKDVGMIIFLVIAIIIIFAVILDI
tara:strand:- start:413 stop:523 length:111 start_codon:yes stop_codon:yes gene_type:complete